jgi:hypothetical protein
MYDAACACAVVLELLQVGVEVGHGVLANALTGEAKLLPVGEFADNARAFVLDDRGRMVKVFAELSIAQQIVRGFWERRRCARI